MNAKFIKLGLITTLVASLSQADQVNMQPFIGIEQGISSVETEYNSGAYTDNTTELHTAIKLGLLLGQSHRIYFKSDRSASLNATYNYLFSTPIDGLRPYLGFGTGYNANDKVQADEEGLSTLLEAAILYKVHKDINLDIGYRSARTSDVRKDTFFVGFLYSF